MGFDWPEALPVVDKVREELDEVLEAMSETIRRPSPKSWATCCSWWSAARHLKVDPENALRAANGKFERRFRFIEQALRDAGRPSKLRPRRAGRPLGAEAKKAERSPSCG